MPWKHAVRRRLVWIIRNIIGTLLILVGVLLCIPGVPGPGSLVILVGLAVLDFKKKHQLIHWFRGFKIVKKAEQVTRVEISAIMRKFDRFFHWVEGRKEEPTMNPKDKIILSEGDLTKADVDAIVNAANNELQLGGGVAGAIRRAGGPAIQEECDKIGPVPLGEAAITTGGRLKARYVIHAASMSLGQPASAEHLAASARNSLLRAGEHGLKTIAFPAIGTGIAGFPLDDCARLMVAAVREHLAPGTSTLEKVMFVLFDQETYDAFARELARG